MCRTVLYIKICRWFHVYWQSYLKFCSHFNISFHGNTFSTFQSLHMNKKKLLVISLSVYFQKRFSKLPPRSRTHVWFRRSKIPAVFFILHSKCCILLLGFLKYELRRHRLCSSSSATNNSKLNGRVRQGSANFMSAKWPASRIIFRQPSCWNHVTVIVEHNFLACTLNWFHSLDFFCADILFQE